MGNGFFVPNGNLGFGVELPSWAIFRSKLIALFLLLGMDTLPFVHVLKSGFQIGQLNFKERGFFLVQFFQFLFQFVNPEWNLKLMLLLSHSPSPSLLKSRRKKISDSFELRNLSEIDLFFCFVAFKLKKN